MWSIFLVFLLLFIRIIIINVSSEKLMIELSSYDLMITYYIKKYVIILFVILILCAFIPILIHLLMNFVLLIIFKKLIHKFISFYLKVFV